MMMPRYFACVALIGGALLAGCQSTLPSLDLNTAVTLNTIYGIENAYGIAVNAANAYKSLPLCKTGTTPDASNICAKRSVIVRLQTAIRRAQIAVNNAIEFQKIYPTVDLTNAIGAAHAALLDVQQVLASGAQ